MQLTSVEIAMGLLGACLSIVACAAIFAAFVLAERNRFERYERLRTILQDICTPDGPHATKLLAVHELGRYREYSGIIARALEKPAERQTPMARVQKPQIPERQISKPQVSRPQASKPQPVPAAPARIRSTLAPFPSTQVANDRTKVAHLAVVETPKRDILDGVIIRERGRPVKASVLREFLRFRDAVTDRLIYRSY